MGINWRETPRARSKNKGPTTTRKQTRLFMIGDTILDKSKNEYTIEQVKELLTANVVIIEDPKLIELLTGEV